MKRSETEREVSTWKWARFWSGGGGKGRAAQQADCTGDGDCANQADKARGGQAEECEGCTKRERKEQREKVERVRSRREMWAAEGVVDG